MVEGCGATISKIFLFIFNVCIWLIGLVMIGGGSYIIAKQNDYTDLFAEDTIITVSAVVIGIGGFAFIVGFCGCCGAMKESKCLLKSYFFFVLLIILLEFTAGILVIVYSDDIEDSMMKGMTDTIHNEYGAADRKGATEAVDDVQKKFDCCGAFNYTDYKYAIHFTGGSVPESCCKDGNTTLCQMGPKGDPTYKQLVWLDGCVHSSKDTIEDQYLVIAGVCLGLIVFEILTLVFTCCLINGISKDYDKFA